MEKDTSLMKVDSFSTVLETTYGSTAGAVDETSSENKKKSLVFLGDKEESFHFLQLNLQQLFLKVEGIYTFTNEDLSKIELHVEPTSNVMKRYNLINKAKSAKTFGIIVINAWARTSGSEGLKRLTKLMTVNEKKYYIFTMSKLL